MAMIKQSLYTVADIMQSDLGGLVLAYEIGQVGRFKMRQTFTPQQLKMLAFVRREEAPLRWDQVLAPAESQWSYFATPGVVSLSVLRAVDPTGSSRVTGLTVGGYCLQLVEPLEAERWIIGNLHPGPAHHWAIALNGGRISRRVQFDPVSEAVVEQLQQEHNRPVKPMQLALVVNFPTEEAADHASWLLAHLGLTVGKLNSVQAVYGQENN